MLVKSEQYLENKVCLVLDDASFNCLELSVTSDFHSQGSPW